MTPCHLKINVTSCSRQHRYGTPQGERGGGSCAGEGDTSREKSWRWKGGAHLERRLDVVEGVPQSREKSSGGVGESHVIEGEGK